MKLLQLFDVRLKTLIKSAVTLGNLFCNLSRNFVVMQVALPSVTYPEMSMSRTSFGATIVARSRSVLLSAMILATLCDKFFQRCTEVIH